MGASCHPYFRSIFVSQHLHLAIRVSTSITMPNSRNSAFVSAFSRAALGHQHAPAHSTSLVRPPSLSSSSSSLFSRSNRPSSSSLHSSSCAKYFHPAPSSRRAVPVPVHASASQQDTEWNEVKVLSVSPACEAHTLLTVNVGTTYSLGSLTDSYRVPGMYVKLLPAPLDSDNDKPLFLAISSPPTISGVFEFLIKDAESNAWVRDLQPGDSVYSSPVQGPGFRLSSLKQSPSRVFLFATGSGIAPIRAAIESPLNGVFPNQKEEVALFYGAQTPQRMPYMQRFKEWTDNGVQVIPVISRPDDAEEGLDWIGGRTGYIQQALKEHGVSNAQDTACLLCGLKGMTEEVKKELIEFGVPEENILFNF